MLVNRLAFDLMLAAAAVTAGVELFLGIKLRGWESSSDGWRLQLTEAEAHPCLPSPQRPTSICSAPNEEHGGSEIRVLDKKPSLIRARCIIDATGRSSRLASWVGARRFVFDRLIADEL